MIKKIVKTLGLKRIKYNFLQRIMKHESNQYMQNKVQKSIQYHFIQNFACEYLQKQKMKIENLINKIRSLKIGKLSDFITNNKILEINIKYSSSTQLVQIIKYLIQQNQAIIKYIHQTNIQQKILHQFIINYLLFVDNIKSNLNQNQKQLAQYNSNIRLFIDHPKIKQIINHIQTNIQSNQYQLVQYIKLVSLLSYFNQKHTITIVLSKLTLLIHCFSQNDVFNILQHLVNISHPNICQFIYKLLSNQYILTSNQFSKKRINFYYLIAKSIKIHQVKIYEEAQSIGIRFYQLFERFKVKSVNSTQIQYLMLKISFVHSVFVELNFLSTKKYSHSPKHNLIIRLLTQLSNQLRRKHELLTILQVFQNISKYISVGELFFQQIWSSLDKNPKLSLLIENNTSDFIYVVQYIINSTQAIEMYMNDVNSIDYLPIFIPTKKTITLIKFLLQQNYLMNNIKQNVIFELSSKLHMKKILEFNDFQIIKIVGPLLQKLNFAQISLQDTNKIINFLQRHDIINLFNLTQIIKIVNQKLNTNTFHPFMIQLLFNLKQFNLHKQKLIPSLQNISKLQTNAQNIIEFPNCGKDYYYHGFYLPLISNFITQINIETIKNFVSKKLWKMCPRWTCKQIIQNIICLQKINNKQITEIMIPKMISVMSIFFIYSKKSKKFYIKSNEFDKINLIQLMSFILSQPIKANFENRQKLYPFKLLVQSIIKQLSTDAILNFVIFLGKEIKYYDQTLIKILKNLQIRQKQHIIKASRYFPIQIKNDYLKDNRHLQQYELETLIAQEKQLYQTQKYLEKIYQDKKIDYVELQYNKNYTIKSKLLIICLKLYFKIIGTRQYTINQLENYTKKVKLELDPFQNFIKDIFKINIVTNHNKFIKKLEMIENKKINFKVEVKNEPVFQQTGYSNFQVTLFNQYQEIVKAIFIDYKKIFDFINMLNTPRIIYQIADILIKNKLPYSVKGCCVEFETSKTHKIIIIVVDQKKYKTGTLMAYVFETLDYHAIVAIDEKGDNLKKLKTFVQSVHNYNY